MIKYRYTIDNTTIETLDISEVPMNVEYEAIEFEEIVEIENNDFQKQEQYQELLPTDWYVVRFIETGVPIPDEISKQRKAIREKYS